jgi:hypothetical protein
MDETRLLIDDFVTRIKDIYNDIFVKYHYSEETNEYEIWHNSEELQFHNPDFLETVGKLMIELLYNKGVFNFSFGYDYFNSTSTSRSAIIEEELDIYGKAKIIFSHEEYIKPTLYNNTSSEEATDIEKCFLTFTKHQTEFQSDNNFFFNNVTDDVYIDNIDIKSIYYRDKGEERLAAA